MSQNCTYDKSTLIQVLACCLQSTGFYMSQRWSRSILQPHAITGPKWAKRRLNVILREKKALTSPYLGEIRLYHSGAGWWVGVITLFHLAHVRKSVVTPSPTPFRLEATLGEHGDTIVIGTHAVQRPQEPVYILVWASVAPKEGFICTRKLGNVTLWLLMRLLF